MATWKKLIVSGSVAELASVSASVGVLVGTNQQIQSTAVNTRLSGSFSGSFAGDGSGLTNVTATATFPTNEITNLTSIDRFFTWNGTNSFTTYGNLLTDLAGSGISVEGSDSLSVNSSSLQTFFNSSSYAGISGDIIINASTGVATIQANSVALGTDTTGDYVTSVSASGALVSSATSGEGSTPNITLNTASTTFTSGVVSALPAGTVSGSSLTSGGQGSVTLTTNGVAQVVDLGLEQSDSPTFVDLSLTGDITVGGNDVKMSGGTTALTFSGTGDVAVAGDLKVGGNDIKASDNTTAISLNGANVTIAGDLTVNGTNTVLNTTTVTVEDRWAIFASGSDDNSDGGIVVQQGASTGFAMGVDASRGRWALQKNFDGTSNSPTNINPDAYMVSVEKSNNNPSSDPVYGGSVTGYGNIHVNEINGEIWIYS